LPSDEEWKELELSVGLSSQLVEIVMWRGYHGNILKKGGSSGFDIILCGAFNGGDDNKFRAMKKFASFWCITEYDNLNAWVREFDRSIYVGRYPVKKNGGNSVRCIKNN